MDNQENKKVNKFNKLTFLVLFLLIVFIVSLIKLKILIAIISGSLAMFISNYIKKNKTELEKNTEDTKPVEHDFKSFFLSSDTYRKKDGDVKRGDCVIKILANTFEIIQGEEIIEYDLDSIYYFNIWEYKDETYFKFRMRNSNELKFRSTYFESEKIAKILKKLNIKVEDDR